MGIDLPEEYLGTEFNLLTVLRGGAGHGRSERSDGTESPGFISHSQEAPYAGGPPPADPADEQARAPAARAPVAHAPAGSACAQEPAPAASPPKAEGKGGVRARGCGKKMLLCLMNTVPWYAELEQQCNFRLNFICANLRA